VISVIRILNLFRISKFVLRACCFRFPFRPYDTAHMTISGRTVKPAQPVIWLLVTLLLALPLLLIAATAFSETGFFPATSAVRTLAMELHLLRLPDDLESLRQFDLQHLRLMRALCAAGVGGSLALAGAMAQGLFRNPMAEPGLLGIGSGAALGAMIAIAMIGGYGPETLIGSGALPASLISGLALAGALGTALTTYRLATRSGRISISILLLTGLAINAVVGAAMATMQVFLLEDYQVSRAMMSWGFGNFDDRSGQNLLVIYAGAAIAIASIPFVALELDLFAGGEEDASALGADPARVKTRVLFCVALATAASVSICGQIGFVGLLVPHIVRSFVGPRHATLLPLSFLFGAVLLLMVVVFQHGLCPWIAESLRQAGSIKLSHAIDRITALQPGVLTSLLGSPFFLYLLLRQGRSAREF
jgi:iron complex transport system permease protein